MNIKILELAQKELEDAALYYEVVQYGLGLRFRDKVRQAIDRIKKYPTSWPIERNKIRKCFVQKFPYKVLYYIQDRNIVILAIAHQHRKPGYWIDRVRNSD